MTTASSRVGRRFGKYSLSRLLGGGGMGEVYEAYDTDKGRTVALKILAEQYSQDERFRTRFQRESHAAAILQEPHVIPIHDWGEIAGALGRAAQRALKGNGHTPSQTDTMPAPGNVGPGWFGAQPGGPATAPTVAAPAGAMRGGSGTRTLLIVVAVASALLLGGVGVVIGLLANQKSGPEPSGAPTTAYPTQPSSAAPEPAITTEMPSAPAAPTSTPESPPADPEAAALQRLRQRARSDRPFVAAELADHWVPQLSSKRPGVVDEGVVWNNAMILQEHLDLREQYRDVRLLWSGDWSTFSAPDYWVTVVGITYPDASGALAWCRSHGFDRDHCVAKLISATHPVPGSTAYN